MIIWKNPSLQFLLKYVSIIDFPSAKLDTAEHWPRMGKILVVSLPEWFAMVKLAHGPVMCRPWAGLWFFYFRNWLPW